MQYYIRYGSRHPVPSTVQILHELKHLSAEEEIRTECAAQIGLSSAASWDEIYARRQAGEARAGKQRLAP